jgi:hypothetical protein
LLFSYSEYLSRRNISAQLRAAVQGKLALI